MHFSRLWYPSQSLLVLIDSLNTDMEDRGCTVDAIHCLSM